MAGGYRLALLLAIGVLVTGLTALSLQVFTHDPPPTPDQPRVTAVKESPRRSPITATPTKHRKHRPTPTHSTSPTGQIVPPAAIGSDSKAVEEALKALGYDVHKVDIDSAAPKDAVVATIPGPGDRLEAEQTVIVVASKGEPADHPVDYVVPAQIIGADADEAEQLLTDQDLHVEKVDIDSTLPEDSIVATYPAPGSFIPTDTIILAVSSGT
jgi:beta-lactam-binding protein with PASTA domain